MEQTTKEIHEEQHRREYLQTRQTFVEMQVSTYKTYDRALLFLSSGAIVLSITVLETNEISDTSAGFLFCAWAFWFCSLLTQLRSYLLSSDSLDHEIAQCDKAYENKNYKSKENKYNKWVKLFNRASFIFFALGSFVFLLFVGINLV